MSQGHTTDPVIRVGEMLLNRYEIINRLGKGGEADVLQARDCETQAIVALKLLHASRATDEQSRYRLDCEADLLLRIEHPNVVRAIRKEIMPDGSACLVMEYLPGHTLRFVLDTADGRLGIPEAVHIALQICYGLEAVHNAAAIHRDIKPENIFLLLSSATNNSNNSKQRVVKLLDFGVARNFSRADFTKPGYVAGTPAYMSPEQARNNPLDARSDLYAVGTVLWEMLCGSRYQPENIRAHSVMWSVAFQYPQLISTRRPVPPALDQLLFSALSLDLAKRPQSATEFAERLEALPLV